MKNIQTSNFKFKETGQESFRVKSRRPVGCTCRLQRPGGCTCRLQRPGGCTCRLQTTYFQTLFRLKQSPLLSEAIVSTTFPTLQTFPPTKLYGSLKVQTKKTVKRNMNHVFPQHEKASHLKKEKNQ